MNIKKVLFWLVVQLAVHMKDPALGFMLNGKRNILSIRQS